MTKICTLCKIEKSLDQFGSDPRVKSGKVARCLKCLAVLNKEWRERPGVMERLKESKRKYARKPETRQRDREYRSLDRVKKRRRQTDKKTPRHIFYATLHHALKRRPTENAATVEDLMGLWRRQEGRCAITGIAMTWAERQGPVPNSISMDRIDGKRGYSIDNIRLVCHAVNAFRGRMSDTEMLSMAKAIVANMEKTAEPSWQSFPAFMNESNFMVLS